MGTYFDIKVINKGDLLLALFGFAFLGILIKVDRSRRISAQTNNLPIRRELKEKYTLKRFLLPDSPR